MSIKVVMYHYVRDFDLNLPGLKSLTFDNFRKQLDYFDKKFGFISPNEWEEYRLNGTSPEKKGKILLTFDDATICHYKHVFPELKRRGLWGIFFVATAPYTVSKILDVHRIQILMAKIPINKFFFDVQMIFSQAGLNGYFLDSYPVGPYQTQQSHPKAYQLKKILNYNISYDDLDYVLSSLEKLYNFNTDLSDFYMSYEQLIELQNDGMLLGAHSVNHRVMSRLSFEEQYEEIIASKKFIQEISLAKKSVPFCFPYGRQHSYNDNTLKALRKADLTEAFSVESKDYERKINSLEIPRYDCNQFPHGKPLSAS